MTLFRTLAPGAMCGPYEIIHELGRGGTAIVYLAEGPDGAKVAIKTLQFAKALQPDKMKRFRAEIHILARIHHINVVRFFDAGRVDTASSGSLMWMAQEYIEGITLREIVHAHGGRVAYTDAARWGAQIANGVAAAHALNVIHRDLKPENVILNTSDAVKVIDFNIAKFREWGVTTTGHKIETLGTLGYMAPEQLEPSFGAISERTDVHALGLILFELLSGFSPLARPDEDINVGMLMGRTLNAIPPRMDRARPGCPSELADILEKTLHKQPHERTASMAELSAQLTNFARSHNEARVQMALNATRAEDEHPSDPPPAPWQPGQKRTVKMVTPEEVIEAGRARLQRATPTPSPVSPADATRLSAPSRALDATVLDRPHTPTPSVAATPSPQPAASQPASHPTEHTPSDALDRSTGVGMSTESPAWRGGLPPTWIARGAGLATGLTFGVLAVALLGPHVNALFASSAPTEAEVTVEARPAAPSSTPVAAPPAASPPTAPGEASASAHPTSETSAPLPSSTTRPTPPAASMADRPPPPAPPFPTPVWRPPPKPAPKPDPFDGFPLHYPKPSR